MGVILIFVAIAAAIAGWWLWSQGLTSKPWLEQGVIGNSSPTSSAPRPASKVGLGVFLTVVTSMFVLLISAYAMRSPTSDWLPVPLPNVLWLNTGMLILSSLALHWAQVAARDRNLVAVKGGLIVGGLTTAAFIVGQLLAWRQLTIEGYFMAANPANAFFFLITALHGLHVLGGLVALGRTAAKVWSEGPVELSEVQLSVELCAIYWHFLLVVWLILFALLAGWGSGFLEICRQVLSS